MKIYLASPFFNDNEIANIHRAVEILKAKGHEVFVPMEHDVENRESLTNAEWAEEIFKIDKGGIDDCDAVVLLSFIYHSPALYPTLRTVLIRLPHSPSFCLRVVMCISTVRLSPSKS